MTTRDTLTVKIMTLALALLFLATAPALADEIERTFSVKPGGQLTVDTDVGALVVTAKGKKEVRILVKRGGRDGEDLELDFQQDGNNITVTGELPDAVTTITAGT